ncbi:jacalin-like lectin [Microbulbifer litoralis]|uniref:jacalin-like lectin n=1 Tax=Microbulbifer litoralis TaxID=2933965 RepID=UPI0020297D9F|nr:jacalin-like lectin [Microbulbifer sp. GX H0434]
MIRNIVRFTAFLFFVFPVVASAKNYWQGPAGGTGGNYFSKTVASHERVCGVYVRHANRVDAIQLKICDQSGNSYRSQRFGGSGGDESFFPISSNEKMSRMLVYVSNRNGSSRVYGLRLYKKTVGGSSVASPLYGTAPNMPWIDSNGNLHNSTDPLDFRVPGIIGVWGRAGGELNSIGLVFSKNQLDNSPEPAGSLVGGSVGGLGGNFLETFRFEGKICRVDIRYGARIRALRFKDCRSNGSAVYTPFYGGTGASLSNFTLRSDEYLTAIEGSMTTRDGEVRLSSIKFVTNQRVSVTYGSNTGRPFRLEIPVGKSPDLLLTRSGNRFHGLRLFSK